MDEFRQGRSGERSGGPTLSIVRKAGINLAENQGQECR